MRSLISQLLISFVMKGRNLIFACTYFYQKICGLYY